MPKVTTNSQKVGSRMTSDRFHDVSAVKVRRCSVEGVALVSDNSSDLSSGGSPSGRRPMSSGRLCINISAGTTTRSGATMPKIAPCAAPSDEHKQRCGARWNTEFGNARAQIGDAHGASTLAHEPLRNRDIHYQGAQQSFAGDDQRTANQDKLPKGLHQA